MSFSRLPRRNLEQNCKGIVKEPFALLADPSAGLSRRACQASPVESTTLVVIAAIFLVYAALSRLLHGTPITAAIVFVGAGFAFGAEGLDWLHVTLGQHAVSVLAEATLVVV